MRWIFVPITALILMLPFSSCGAAEPAENYIATCIVGDNVTYDKMGFPVVSGEYLKYLIFPDKTYTCVGYSRTSEGDWEEKTRSSVRLRSWNDLTAVLQGRVIMRGGDTVSFSVDQFVRYMEDLYPESPKS